MPADEDGIILGGEIMTLIAERIYAPEDFLSNPNLAGYELVNGQLTERPTSKSSSRVGGQIQFLLQMEADKTGNARIYPSNMCYHCFPDSPATLRFADVSLILTLRDREVGDDADSLPIPADLVVEVLSPNDKIKAIDDKGKEYLKAGFGLVWVVNPTWRHVHIYRPDGSVQLLSEHEEITGEAALPSFRCKVSEFFAV
jgi:Uma2 family endonuclease